MAMARSSYGARASGRANSSMNGMAARCPAARMVAGPPALPSASTVTLSVSSVKRPSAWITSPKSQDPTSAPPSTRPRPMMAPPQGT